MSCFFQCIQNMHCSSDIAEKPFIPNFDLEIRPWWVFRKIWPLPESYSLWCVDAKSVLKMICASISSRITRDRSLKTRPTYFSPSLATTPVLCNSLWCQCKDLTNVFQIFFYSGYLSYIRVLIFLNFLRTLWTIIVDMMKQKKINYKVMVVKRFLRFTFFSANCLTIEIWNLTISDKLRFLALLFSMLRIDKPESLSWTIVFNKF